jgi:L-ribulokinase
VHDLLSAEAAAQPAGAHGLIALDWLNGNRSVLVDHHLSGVVAGLTLATRAPDIYRALIESTAFGTRVIIDAFEGAGVSVAELVIAGGLTRNELIMQIYADVTRRPLSLIGAAQGPAQGSAIHAAVAAGAYPDVPAAAAVMGSCTRGVYTPDPASADIYDQLYAEYVTLHDYFGRGANEVLHRLRALRDRVLASRAAAGETAKAPASQSQGPQAIGGSGGALPRARGARP